MKTVIALCILLFALPIQAQNWDAAPPPQKAKAPKAAPQPIVMEAIFESAFVGKQHVVYVLPPDYDANSDTYPAVLSFAGKGESVRGNKAGAWGWVEKYGVVPAMAALHRGTPLTPKDFQGLVKGAELDAYNDALKKHPYKGVILVCPYPPNGLGGVAERGRYAQYLFEELLPYTRTHLRVPKTREGWGVDGISLGGLLSTWVGFEYPQHFAAIGSQQASVGSRWAFMSGFVKKNFDALRTRHINIATSSQDPFKNGLIKFSANLEKAGVDHRFTILPGRHDKQFVKGPGSMELLLFHDRVLHRRGNMPPEVRKR